MPRHRHRAALLSAVKRCGNLQASGLASVCNMSTSAARSAAERMVKRGELKRRRVTYGGRRREIWYELPSETDALLDARNGGRADK